ncbi:MAG TPA: peptidase C13 [Dyella sp.]|uniref:peptidase C13 n=1 Tax=Dyella sp. TaxID=1869338 RepID=UPI002D77D051|nr:peptidase C13 [Dyella sp.]HET6553549.1 peptidase C13 [Dyella sp.]
MSVLLALALQLAPAAGSDFHARVTQAKLAEGAATGPAYQKQMWDRIGNPTTDAYKSCLASNAPADRSPFTLVADVMADGRLAQIEVQPQTPIARCMAGQFATWMLPAPPASPAPYPVEIDFSIKN